ncbi:Transposase and inactivated derivatives [Acinetobacter baumannii]|nr:Transposase and inactivated derivatives [Acinetobacter baumannii]
MRFIATTSQIRSHSASYPLSMHNRSLLHGLPVWRASSVSATSFMSCVFAPATTSASGSPFPSVIRLRFTPRFPRSVGFLPVFLSLPAVIWSYTIHRQRKLFDGQMIEQLHDAFSSAAGKLECEIIEMDGEPDHVHLLVAYPPKLAVSVMVNNLKSVSSRMLRQQNTHLRMQSKTGLLWSRSYFVCSTGGATIETLRAYIQSQSTPD